MDEKYFNIGTPKRFGGEIDLCQERISLPRMYLHLLKSSRLSLTSEPVMTWAYRITRGQSTTEVLSLLSTCVAIWSITNLFTRNNIAGSRTQNETL